MLQRVQAYTVTHTKLARVPSDLYSKGLNVTVTTGNKKGPYNAPMGVPAHFSGPQSPLAKDIASNSPEFDSILSRKKNE